MKSEPLDRPSNYQARDEEVIDYSMTELPGTQHLIRGPLPDLSKGNYITCLGAAQTFGCFCETPYPDQLRTAPFLIWVLVVQALGFFWIIQN